ncbi:MAG: GtrA family protein [Brucellaceae bacterium]|nr:GtrA family protein [Brucellaceae bacterium]
MDRTAATRLPAASDAPQAGNAPRAGIAIARLRFVRFSVVGLVATIVHVGMACAARAAFGISPVQANAFGFFCAAVVSYLGHHRWTFGRRGNHATHVSRFAAVSAVALASSHLITVTVTQWMHLPYAVALAGILFIVPPTTYLFGTLWTFAEIDARAHRRRFDVPWLLAAAAVSALVGAGVLLWLRGTTFNHDTSWYFVATRMWMAGTPLYSGIMEINPPMPFYLTRGILHAGDWFGLPDAEAFRIALFAAAALSLTLTARALASVPVSSPVRAVLLVSASLALFVVPLHDFGQREHILLILVMPYVLASAVRTAGWTQPPARVALMALFALPGLLLKPHFFAIPLILTLHRMYEHRSLRPLFAPDNLLIGAAAAAFLAAVWLLHPDYLGLVVPLGAVSYVSVGMPAVAVVSGLGLVAAAAAAWRLLATEPQPDDMSAFRGALLAAVAAGFAIYAVQFKGFNYHLIPLHGFALLAGIWILLTNRTREGRIGAVVAFALVAHVAIVTPLRQGPYANPLPERILDAIGGDTAGRSAMVFSANVSRAFPLINKAGMRWASRYPTQWVVPGAWVGCLKRRLAE